MVRLRMKVTRLLFVAAVAVSLIAGLLGGLVRAGLGLPPGMAGPWLAPAVVAHAFLMICAFMGTLIGVERAVALRHPLAFVGPVASGLAGVAMLAGAASLARWLAAAAAVAFVMAATVIVKRQRAAHTVLLVVAGVAWLVGCLVYAVDLGPGAVIPFWFSFLVLTIAAERLEMTRLMRRRAGAASMLYAIFGLMLAGAALSAWTAVWGGLLYGVALLSLGVWLMVFDIARRTVHAHGLSRYMAVCLLAGYGWLCIAGVAWMATALGLPWRDAALHGLALGFVLSMMLGHAPVILPALTRVKLLFTGLLYVPLVLLHASLIVRLLPGSATTLAHGAAGNVLAIAAFVLVVLGAALAWRVRYADPGPTAVQGTSSVSATPATNRAAADAAAGGRRLRRL